MPTAVFYNSETLGTHFGRDAVAQYLEGTSVKLTPVSPAPLAQ